MTEVPDNAESPLEGEVEPEAPGPAAGSGRPPDRIGYVARLQALPVWPEVLSRLTRGDSALSIATWLVNEQAFEVGSVRSLSEMLTRYRRRLPQATVMPPPALTGFAGQDWAQPRTGESLLREIQWAIHQQVARIRKSRKVEKTFPMASRQVTADLDLLLKMAVDRANLAMRLGLAKEVPQQFNVASLGVYADVATLPPDARHRILEVASKIVRRARLDIPPPAGDGDGDGAG